MALTTYTEFATAVEAWLNRVGAQSIAANAEDFILLGQVRMQSELRVSGMEVGPTTLTITSSRATVPTGYIETKHMVGYDGSNAWDINRGTYTEVRNRRIQDGSGPTLFDTIGTSFEFGPNPSSGVSVDLVYYRKLTNISPTNASNWFSDNHPDLVLAASLLEASIFMKDTEQESKYEKLYGRLAALIKKEEDKAQSSGRLQVRAN